MNQDWVEKKLDEVCTLQRGFDLPKKDRIPGAIPLMSASGRIDSHADAKVKGPGVVTGRSGSIGGVFYVQEDFWPLNTTLYVKNFHGNDPRFVFYLLSSFNLARFTSGAGVPTLNRNSVHKEIVKVPLEIKEQKRIVTILDEAFAGIEKAVANTEKNLANARELFESYLNSVFKRPYENWKVRPLSKVCEIKSRLIDPRNSEFIDLPHIGAGNIVSETGEIRGLKTARSEGLKSGKFAFDQQTILYSKIRPYLKKVARPEFKGICSADIYPLKPDSQVLNQDFLYYMLLSMDFTEYAIAGSARAGMPKVNRDHLFKYRAALPDIEEQKRLVDLLDIVALESARLESIYQQKRTALAELKQSLLQKAFSGELTAKDSNKAKAAAA